MSFVTRRLSLADVELVYDDFATELGCDALRSDAVRPDPLRPDPLRPDALDAPRSAGTGDPLVVLVMGLGVQRIHWPDGFCEELGAHGVRVVRFDLRDSGQSRLRTRAPSFARIALGATKDAILGRLLDGRDARELFAKALPYTLDELADDVIALVDHLGAREAHVVGMSFGGAVAQHCALRHPDRIRSLVSIASTTGALAVSRPKWRALPVVLARPPRTAAHAERAFVRALSIVGSATHRMPEDEARALATEAFARCSDGDALGRMWLAMMAAGDRTSSLSGLRCPTLVVHGQDDPLVPPAAGEATARAIPGAKWKLVPAMGHDLPRALWPELTASIAEHVRAAGPFEDASHEDASRSHERALEPSTTSEGAP